MMAKKTIPSKLFDKILDYYRMCLEYWVANLYYFDCSYDILPVDKKLEDGLIPEVTKDHLLKALKDCVVEFEAQEIEQDVLSASTLRSAIQRIGQKYLEKEPERKLKRELAAKKAAQEEQEKTERKIRCSNEWAESVKDFAHSYVSRTGLPYYSFDGLPHENRFSDYAVSFNPFGCLERDKGWLDDDSVLYLASQIPSLRSESSFLDKAATAYALLERCNRHGDTFDSYQQWRKVVYFPSGECLPADEVFTACRAIYRELLLMAIKQEVPDLAFSADGKHFHIKTIVRVDSSICFSATPRDFTINSLGDSISLDSSRAHAPLYPSDTKSAKTLSIIRRIFNQFKDAYLRKYLLDTVSFELGIEGKTIGVPTLKAIQKTLMQNDTCDKEIVLPNGMKRPFSIVQDDGFHASRMIILYLLLHKEISIGLNGKSGNAVFYPRQLISHKGYDYLGGYIHNAQTRDYIDSRISWKPGATSMRCGNAFYHVAPTDKDSKTLAWLTDILTYINYGHHL